MSARSLLFCDRCLTSIAANYDETRIDLFNRADTEGWISVRQAGTYRNFCPDCMNQKVNEEAA